MSSWSQHLDGKNVRRIGSQCIMFQRIMFQCIGSRHVDSRHIDSQHVGSRHIGFGVWISFVAAWVFVVACAIAPHSFAANGDVITLPLSRTNKAVYSKQSGLQLVVDTTWAGNRGYRPVRVTANMAAPSTSDTQITIEFFAGDWQSDNRAITAEHDFELAQGSAGATAHFSVPQYVDWNTFGWNVWVDGVKEEALCLDTTGFNSGSNGAIATGRFDMGTLQRTRSGAALLQTVSSSTAEEHTFNLSTLPESWVDYSPLDVVTTSAGALELARVSAPEKLTALRRWVRAGGNLWVLDVGLDFEELPVVEKALTFDHPKLAPVDGPGAASEVLKEDGPSLGKWKFVKLNETGRTRLKELVQLSMDGPTSDQALSRSEQADSKFADTAVDSRHWFVARAYGLGTVVAIQDPLNKGNWQQRGAAAALQRSSLTDNLQWTMRHGNDPGSGNPHFNNWLLADVGTAPVLEFQLLISLFAIGIGPVNYWLLKRRNQLPLLLLTVPVAALVATLMLFAYGFLSDGIGARIRTRSVTTLDQLAGECATWGRLSYYAGIAPSDGLKMPIDTTLYPILPSHSQSSLFGRRHTNQQRGLAWTNHQRLTRGWLGSRTPTQYLSITSRATQKRLQLERSGGEMQVANQLGTKISTLIVQDHAGNIFLGAAIAAEGKASLKQSNYTEAASALRRALSENLPELPAGYVETRTGRRRRSRRNELGNSMTESLLELHLEAVVTPTATGWGNGTFVAITSEAIELSLGLPDLVETDSLHLVRGTW